MGDKKKDKNRDVIIFMLTAMAKNDVKSSNI